MTDQPDQLKLVKIASCRVYTRGVSFLKGTLCSVDDITASDHYPSCKWIKLATIHNFGLHDRYGELVKAGILRTDTIRFDSDSVLMGDVIVTLLRMASVDAYKGTIYPSYGNQTPNTTQPANPHKETGFYHRRRLEYYHLALLTDYNAYMAANPDGSRDTYKELYKPCYVRAFSHWYWAAWCRYSCVHLCSCKHCRTVFFKAFGRLPETVAELEMEERHDHQ